MPKFIQTMCDVLPEEAVLVRSAYLRNNIKASALVAEARRRSKKMIAEAEAEAKRVFDQVRTEGYIAGVLQAVNEIVTYLGKYVDLASQLQMNLQDQVSILLSTCVNNPDVVMATLKECLSEEERGDQTLIVELLLPEAFKSNHQNLVTRLCSHLNGRISIDYQPGTRFLLRVGDHVAEFAPKNFVALATGRVVSSLPSVYAESRAIAETCRQRILEVFTSEEYVEN